MLPNPIRLSPRVCLTCLSLFLAGCDTGGSSTVELPVVVTAPPAVSAPLPTPPLAPSEPEAPPEPVPVAPAIIESVAETTTQTTFDVGAPSQRAGSENFQTQNTVDTSESIEMSSETYSVSTSVQLVFRAG